MHHQRLKIRRERRSDGEMRTLNGLVSPQLRLPHRSVLRQRPPYIGVFARLRQCWRILSAKSGGFDRLENTLPRVETSCSLIRAQASCQRILVNFQIAEMPDWLPRRFAVSPFRSFVRHYQWRVFSFGKRLQSVSQISFSISSAVRAPLINTMRFGSRSASSRYALRTRS